MAQHVKIVGILNIVLGCFGVLGGLIGLALFGGIAGLVHTTDSSPDAAVAVPILGAIGGILFVVLLVISLPSIICGWGLMNFRPWARIFGIVMSALHLLNFPFGTAVGVYGLWALLSNGTEQLFAPTVPPPPPRTQSA